MSCDRRCFDKDDTYYGYDDCPTCPGRDDGHSLSNIELKIATEIIDVTSMYLDEAKELANKILAIVRLDMSNNETNQALINQVEEVKRRIMADGHTDACAFLQIFYKKQCTCKPEKECTECRDGIIQTTEDSWETCPHCNGLGKIKQGG